MSWFTSISRHDMTFRIFKNKNIKIGIFLETCKTVGSSGSPCVFPFVYRDQTYDTCTTRDSDTGQPWCATKVDSDGWVVDHAWGDCDQEQCLTKDSLHANWTRLELYKNINQLLQRSIRPFSSIFSKQWIVLKNLCCELFYQGCPGTLNPCDDKFFSIQEGKCIDVSVPGAIPNWFGAPVVKLGKNDK